MRIFEVGYRLRLFSVFYGILLLLWLSVEDNQTLTVVLMGTGLSIVGMLLWVGQHYGGMMLRGWRLAVGFILIGVLIGGGAILATTALMFLKTAWHSHLYPDYPSQMMLDMLAQLPVWTLSGGLIGLAIALSHHAMLSD